MIKKSASTMQQNGWRYVPTNLEDSNVTKFMTPVQVQAKAAQLEHDKTVDTLIRRLVNEDHIREINEYDVRKKTVTWGLKRAQNESIVMQFLTGKAHLSCARNPGSLFDPF